MMISIRSAHGTFVVAEGGGDGDVNANRMEAKSWETFKLCDAAGIPFGDDAVVPNESTVTLKTLSGGRFLYPDWGGKVLANARTPVGAAFCLSVRSGAVKAGASARVALRSPAKRPKPGSTASEYYWVTAEHDDPRPVVANRQMAAPATWEKFNFIVSLGTQIIP